MAETVEQISVSVRNLTPSFDKETNPNRMSPQEYAALVAFMKEEGAIQTILVHPTKKKGHFKIIDGHHRYWAAKDLGIAALPAIVLKAADARAKAIGIGLNQLRGELDLTIAGAMMEEIMAETNWTSAQLSTLTGFSPSKIEALTEKASSDSEDALEEISLSPVDSEDDKEVNAKPYVLEITFADKETYRLCRKKLKRAAGKGGDLARGLLSLLGEDVDAEQTS